MPEVLALSDDEDTPRKPLLRPGTRPCTPITPGHVVWLGPDDDEAEFKVTPFVAARKTPRRKGPFFDLDDCSIVSVTPAKALEDCTIIREVPSSSKKRIPKMPDRSVPSSTSPSIIREAPSSSMKTPPRMSDPSVRREETPSSMITPPPRMPDPYESQIPTDWTPHWSPEWSPEEPQTKRQRFDAASPHALIFPDDPTPAHDLTFPDDPTSPENPAPAPAPAPCDLPPPGDVDMAQRSASGGTKVSEEERQRRFREKELELERKQAEREEKKREKEEAKRRQQEELKQKKEEEKARKAAARQAAVERRKAEADVANFDGKEALKNLVAFVDLKVVEKGYIGGHLLSRFAEKNLTLKVEKNPLESSITLRTKRPVLPSQDSQESQDDDDDVTGSQVSYEDVDIQYLIFIFEAEEFSAMVAESALYTHARKAQVLYPGYTICYVVNKLTAYLKKKDQDHYQSPHDPANIGWKRPPVEKALAGLLTNFTDVHSLICIDEAEVADYVIKLMPVLAKSYNKPKLSKLSVLKNGGHITRDNIFQEEIRQNLWLKALVAIPKVSGPCAVSIGKMYPTMRSLYSVYLDKQKTEREKELLLQNLRKENVLGPGAKKIGPVCSKRIFHVLMARDGNLKVDNIEEQGRGDEVV